MPLEKNIPIATYRLQFTPQFRFDDCTALAGYLADLGISHVYASPIFKARSGSMHGYDICDPLSLNPELGTWEGFVALTGALHKSGMGWIQDIVPNHMAYGPQNVMMVDVLEFGPSSRYGGYFDIEWDHPYENLRGKVLAPFLAAPYGQAVEFGGLKVGFDEQGVFIDNGGMRFPVCPESYAKIFSVCIGALKSEIDDKDPAFIKFAGALLSLQDRTESKTWEEHYTQALMASAILKELHAENLAIRRCMDGAIERFNGSKEHPEGFDLFDELHDSQFYRLAFWKAASEELNYRRFFTISDLIGVRMEKQEVFDHFHSLTFKMLEEGLVQGLRVDHIDGLFNPIEYLRRIRERFPDIYLVVEKILGENELLPQMWPVQGTTGYDFLDKVNELFVKSSERAAFERLYTKFTGRSADFRRLVKNKKHVIIDKYMAGDIENLALLLKRLAGRNRAGSDITMVALRRAFVELLASFPVYRTYISPEAVSPEDRTCLDQAVYSAEADNPALIIELEFIRTFFIEAPEEQVVQQQPARLEFLMRLQQFTGALMAKGFEDTLLYTHNVLTSLNEVGGYPDRFGITLPVFHEFSRKRQELSPATLNATATHDTKRGEDVRARINVLSEIPGEWEQQVRGWHRVNRKFIKVKGNETIPDPNDEYLLYQTLTGSFPFESADLPAYADRIRAYMLKAIREAKEHTTWIAFDAEYEEGMSNFISGILQPGARNAFMKRFTPFQKKIAWLGIFNSLSQVTLKLTAPGVPDIYQGCELWDLSLVDPDNRRPVDFERRKQALSIIRDRGEADLPKLIEEMLADPASGLIKMFVIYHALALRKRSADVFNRGQYLPLSSAGTFAHSLVGFIKKYAASCVAVVVPRFPTGLIVDGPSMPLGRQAWQDTVIRMPAEAVPAAWRNVLTGEELPGAGEYHAGDILKKFPVAILEG